MAWQSWGHRSVESDFPDSTASDHISCRPESNPPKFVSGKVSSDRCTNDTFNKADLRLEKLRQTIDNFQGTYGISLKLIDMGTEEGGTFPVHQKMYEAIAGSGIIICDLTGRRPNLYVEAGFALTHHE